MNSIEKIRQEIERRIKRENEILWNAKLRGTYASPSCEYNLITLTSLRDFIDSLPDEEPSKDLEEAASRGGFDYVDEIEAKAPGLPWNDHDVEFGYRDGFIAGAEWQKEQMMKEAVEFECIGKKVKMTVQELINYYIDTECCDVADECGF